MSDDTATVERLRKAAEPYDDNYGRKIGNVMREAADLIEQQAARLAECERDAERYRWLASRSAYFSLSVYPGFREGEHHDMWDMNGKHFPSLDDAIDGAKQDTE
jgi:hypothetical protein